MMSIIWIGMLAVGILVGASTGDPQLITGAALSASREAVQLALGLAGSIALWSGLARIAERAGVMDAIAALARPVIAPLFPDLPRRSPALSSIAMSVGANLLGLGSAATPLGLRAMRQMWEAGGQTDTATDPMCTFLAITASSVTLVPSTVVALRAQLGSASPAEVIGTTIFATCCSTGVAILLDAAARHSARRRRGRQVRRGG